MKISTFSTLKKISFHGTFRGNTVCKKKNTFICILGRLDKLFQVTKAAPIITRPWNDVLISFHFHSYNFFTPFPKFRAPKF